MPVYKNEKNGTWYVMIRYKDWTGTNKQKCQRGFSTRKRKRFRQACGTEERDCRLAKKSDGA